MSMSHNFFARRVDQHPMPRRRSRRSKRSTSRRHYRSKRPTSRRHRRRYRSPNGKAATPRTGPGGVEEGRGPRKTDVESVMRKLSLNSTPGEPPKAGGTLGEPAPKDGGTPMKKAVEAEDLREWMKNPQLELRLTTEFQGTWRSIVDHVHELAFLSRSDKKVTTVYAHLMNNEGSLMQEYASSAMTKRMDTLSYEILIENLRKFMKVNYENGLYIRIFKVETTGSTDTSYYKLTKAPKQQIWKPYRYYQQRTQSLRISNVTHPSGGGGRAFGPGPTGPHPGLRVK